MCGLHAQVMSSAELTAWAPGSQALAAGARSARALWEERTLVKTWAMRGYAAPVPGRRRTSRSGTAGLARP